MLNYLIIDDKSALDFLNIQPEPEYFYTDVEIKKLLLEGSLDQLEDCLTFAPNGVIDLISSVPKRLMQSTELTLARFELLNNLNVPIEVVPKNLFASQKDFIKKFGFTNEETLKGKQLILKKKN